MIWAPLFLLVVALHLAFEWLRKPMNAAERQRAPGKFATLSQGVTHYQWKGPADGPVVLCVHGLTTPSFVWESTSAALAADGFRVLTYDLYGRGFSDRPRGLQTDAFFARQIDDLLAHEKVDGKLLVIGYSMGGAIATAYAAMNPDRVRGVVLLAAAGMRKISTPFQSALIRTPMLGYWSALSISFPGLLRGAVKAEQNEPTSVPNIAKRQLQELRFRGFIPAIKSSMLGILAEDQEDAHRAVKKAALPLLAIWGKEDAVIPPQSIDRLASWNPKVEQHVIEGAGHAVTYSHTLQVLELVKPFLRRVT